MTAHKTNTSDGFNVSEVESDDLLGAMKREPQWICWNYEDRDGEQTKVPIDPSTGSYASASDTDTWTTYEAARDYHDDADTDGLGFVFSKDGLYAGIDLDNARDPDTGELQPWARDIVERVDSYTEVSPSGTGLHILVYALLPDGGNKGQVDSALARFDDGEVEMYDEARFFTMSFDHVDGTPREPRQRKSEFAAVHEEYVADDTEDESAATDFDDVDLDLDEEEILEKAKEDDEKFVDLWNGDTSEYEDDHSRADLALSSKLAFWTACDREMMDSLFRQSDLMRPKWDEVRGDETYGEMTIRKAIEGTDEVYEGDVGSSDSDVDLVRRDDGYYRETVTFESGDPVREYEEVTNFHLSREEVIIEDGEELVRLEVKPANGSNFTVTVSPTVFNEPRDFKKHICTRLSTSFSGSSHDLPELRKLVLYQDSPQRQGTKQIGLHDGEVVTPGETFTSDDVDEHTYTYRDTGATVAKKWEIDDLDYDEDEVQRILELLPQTRTTERGLPVIAYYYASLFAPVIRDVDGALSTLSVTGESGAGKSTVLRILSQAFGMDATSYELDSTAFSLIKQLSATNNVPIWYDEYKLNEYQDYEIQRFEQKVKKSTNGLTATRGNQDQTETQYPLVAPVVISGEQRIQNPAVNRRAVLTQLVSKPTTRGTEYHDAFHDLRDYDLSNHAKFVIEQVIDIVNSDEDIAEIWEQSKEHVLDVVDGSELGDLELQAVAMVKFGAIVYQTLCGRSEAYSVINDADIDRAIQYVAEQKGADNRKSHVDEFVEQVVRCIDDGTLESTQWAADEGDYKLVSREDAADELRIRLDRVYPSVSKYLRDYDLSIDMLAEDDYKDRFSDMEDSDTYVVSASKQTRPLNRCVALDVERMCDQLDVHVDDIRAAAGGETDG